MVYWLRHKFAKQEPLQNYSPDLSAGTGIRKQRLRIYWTEETLELLHPYSPDVGFPGSLDLNHLRPFPAEQSPSGPDNTGCCRNSTMVLHYEQSIKRDRLQIHWRWHRGRPFHLRDSVKQATCITHACPSTSAGARIWKAASCHVSRWTWVMQPREQRKRDAYKEIT